MMSLGVAKGGLIPPSDEDRRRIIRQMKVRTTLRGDKSWIQHHNSDSDEEKSSPLSGQAGGGSTAPKAAAPQQDRCSVPKAQPGYLIRGVFTRTIDKSSSVPDSSPSSQAQKNTALKGQSRSPSGYRMTTEDYKKLAPYNVRQKSMDADEEDAPFSPDEHKKRTEAANSVLRRSAGRERAYVLSAAKKSNGSPTQEFPALIAKRIEIEEEEGQQRRNPTVPAPSSFAPDSSSANGLRKTSPGSTWDEPKAAAAASPSSPKPGSRSQTSPSLSDTSGKISTSADVRNGDHRQALDGKFSLGTVSQHGDGDKVPKEKPERFPRDEGTPRATNGRFPEHTEANNGFYPPECSSASWDRAGDAPEKLLRPSEPSLGDTRSSLQSDVPFHPTERTPVHIEDTEYSFKRSVLGYEERSSSTNPEGPSYHQPYWDETRLLDSSILSERGQGAPGHDAPPEPPRLKDPTEPSRAGCVSESILESGGDQSVPVPRSELCSQDTAGSRDRDVGMSSCLQREETTAGRLSSDPAGSSVPAPEIPRGNESEPRRDRITLDYEGQTSASTDSPRESLGDWRHSEPTPGPAGSEFSSQESVPGSQESQPPVSLFQDRQSFGGSVPSHRIPGYVDSQMFSTRSRPSPDPRGSAFPGSSSPRSSWYDGARGHGDFSPPAGRHESLPRDPTMSMSQRSHRVPFYMDSLNCNSTRLLSSSSERLCSSHHSSGYQPDSSTAGRGILFVKEYVNTGGFAASPRHGSLVDLSDLERSSYSHHSYLSSAPLHRSSEPLCSYCSREIRDCPKIIIEHLNIHCHEYCFRCGICHKAMGELLDKIFIHRDIVHCDKCYEKLF
ncbi:zinc finger protein 185 isoform X3 [Cyanistes caeruleus]|uniref:zinc finger protein 185 isoform X3 n=1 Tax=Cyanistes caeruleus TaxID=156563 RepID=UPI000CDB1943|nr:zinc finger protein 185 isoform X3 [Cyanistes caeruleus]